MINPEIENKIAELEKVAGTLIDHRHNGFDSSRVSWQDLNFKKFYLSHTIYGANAATASNYGVFFIVPFDCTLHKFQEVHQTAGTDASDVTLTLEKLTGTEALGAGTAMLASTLSLKATANTVQTGSLSTTLSSINLATGDRLALRDAGTLTAVNNVTVLVELAIK